MTANNPGKHETTKHESASSDSASSHGAKGGDSPAATTTAKLASAAHSAVDVAATNLEKAEQALREAHPAQRASETALSLSQTVDDTLRAYIHQYPLRSIGIAVATGFLLSAMTKK